MAISTIRKVIPWAFFSTFFLAFVGLNLTVLSMFFSFTISLLISIIATSAILGVRLTQRGGILGHHSRGVVNFYIGTLFIFFIFAVMFRMLSLFFSINIYQYSIVSLFFLIIAIYSSQTIIVKNYTISSSKVKKKYSIIHISDIHIGSNPGFALKRVVDIVNSISADFVFITGDLVDEDITLSDLKHINDFKIKPYFIYGNHEHYVNQKNLSNIFSNVNITILKDESITKEDFQIIGIDDKSNLSTELDKIKVDSNKFSILLNHQPSLITFVESKGINLMLSGHTHGGQIWPFNYLVRLQYKYVKGFHKIKSLFLNVSPGTGTWGPRMRLFTTSEVSVITIKPKK